MSNTPVDKLGQEITVGAYIVYGHAYGRAAALRLGRVLAIKEKDQDGTKTTRYSVIGVDDDYAWWGVKPRLVSKKSTLLYDARIIVLPREMIPPEIKSLLDQFQE